MPTLADLKAENAAEEKAALAANAEEQKDPPADDPPADPPKDEEKDADPPVDKDPPDDDKEKEPVVDDAWMKPEDEPDVVHTGFDAKAIREKWKGRATAAEDKAEQLERENAELKQRLQNPITTTTASPKPLREQYKTDAEFIEALTDYKINQSTQVMQAEQAVAAKKQQQTAAQAKTANLVDEHYQRAITLSTKSGIKPEAYQSADLNVRRAIESVFPKAGDAITDNLIARMGAGSEKVVYHLGVSPKKLTAFVNMLAEDKSGLGAATYLGTLKAELNAPARRETKAPDPIDEVRGDKSGAKAGSDKLKKDYDAAHAKNDSQGAFNARRKAKKAGIDVSKW